MLLTRDDADAFGDWLALDRLRTALLSARPALDGSLVLDPARPLLRIHGPGDGAVIVARSVEDIDGRWIVGVPGHPSPLLHDVDSEEDAAAAVLDALAQREKHCPPLRSGLHWDG